MFYSSSNQQSQRYAEIFKGVKDEDSPPADEPQIIDLDYAILPRFKISESERVYRETFTTQFRAYRKLTDLIRDDAAKDFFSRFPKLEGTKQGEANLRRRCLEIARYVLPLGTMAHLWYTISCLSAFRMDRYPDSNTTREAQLIGDLILEKWAEKSPENIKILAEKPITIPYEETAEGKFFSRNPDISRNREFIREFDLQLNGFNSRLINYTQNAAHILGVAVRSVVGKSCRELSDQESIDLVLNPAKNPSLIHPLDDKLRSPLSLCLANVSYTFAKKISNTCDSQNQRHRTVPGGRPILSAQYTADPEDCIIPGLISNQPQARELYIKILRDTYSSINHLLDSGEPWENVQYLLPNATPVRFVETGSLLFLHSKFRERLCWNAQKEIWDVTRQELEQIRQAHPEIAKFLGAPCHVVDWGKRGVALEGTKLPLSIGSCPESRDRYCGVKAWEIPTENWKRTV